MLDFKKVTSALNIHEVLSQEEDNVLIFYSETSVDKNKIKLNKSNFTCYSTKEVTKEKNRIDNLFKDLNKYQKIYSIGGGSALDIGKYLSYKFHIPVIAVPTMLSTNAYATNKVALRIDGKVVSIDAVLPSKVYFDREILLCSKDINLYGLVDIFSIYTALNDWDLAIKYNNEEKHNEYISAKELLKTASNYVLEKDKDEIEENVEFIYEIIGESGLITNIYGCGKPESGSEHIYAKLLEKEVNIPHAVSVTNGIVLMIISRILFFKETDLSDSDIKIINILKRLNMFELNLKYNINFELIKKTYKSITPREDRFSIVNLIYKDEDLKDKVLDKYKEIMKGYLK